MCSSTKPDTLREGNNSADWRQSTWGLFTYHVPTVYQIPDSFDLPNAVVDRSDVASQYYTLPDDSQHPGFMISTVAQHGRLFRIVHDMTLLFYGSESSKVVVQDLRHLFDRLQTWKENLPEDVSFSDGHGEGFPHVLSLQ